MNDAAKQTDPSKAEAARPVWVIGTADGSGEAVLSLREILAILYRGKWIVAVTVVLALAASVLFLAFERQLYTVTMAVIPVSHLDGEPAPEGEAGILGLLGAAGVRPSALTRPEYELYKYHLTSIETVRRLQEKHGLLQRYYANSWDPAAKTWKPRSGGIAGAIDRLFGLPGWQPPTHQSLAQALASELVFETDGSSIETVAIEHDDPETARELLSWLHAEANRLVRERDDVRLNEQLAYLQSRVGAVQIVEQKLLLNRLMLGHMQRRMLIDNDLPYAAQMVQAPTASAGPTWPRPTEFLALALFAGVLFGIVLAFGYEGIRRR